MKKYSFVFIFLFVCTAILVSFASNANSNDVADFTESIHNAETKIYAIYPSKIIESSPAETNKYIHYKRNVDIQFPQIYFANDYTEYIIDIETQINKLLFELSIGKDDRFLLGRDTREIKEYCSDYTITKSDDDIFSIKYYGHLYSISHAREFCFGITINAKTGKMAEMSDFITIDENLIRNLENGIIKCHSAPNYDKTIVIAMVLEFIKDYNILPEKNNSFFITENSVNLIIPVIQGNSNYIILEAPYEQ